MTQSADVNCSTNLQLYQHIMIKKVSKEMSEKAVDEALAEIAKEEGTSC